MVKRVLGACIALGLLVSGQFVHAAEVKLGFVNLAKLMSDSPLVQEVTESLREEFRLRSDDLLATKNKLEKDREAFVRESALMTEEQRQHAERVLLIRQRELRLDEIEFKEEVAIRRTSEMEKVKSVVSGTVREYGKKNGYFLIFFDGVAYADEVADITDSVIAELGSSK